MVDEINSEKADAPPLRQTIRNLLIEMSIYGILLAGYFIIVIKFFGDPLKNLFDQNLTFYAIVGFGLIVGQALVLEFITSLVFDFLGLNRLTSK